MLSTNDLYAIKLYTPDPTVYVCKIISHNKTNDTYTVSVRGNGVLTGITGDQLEDIETPPKPVVEI